MTVCAGEALDRFYRQHGDSLEQIPRLFVPRILRHLNIGTERDKVRVGKGCFPVAEALLLGKGHETTSGLFNYYLPCRGIPFHRATETKIDVSFPFREATEFYGRTTP